MGHWCSLMWLSTDLSHSLCLCILSCKHSCSFLSCQSCRHHGFHKVAVHMGLPLGGDKDKQLLQHGSCTAVCTSRFCQLAYSINKTDLWGRQYKATYTSGTGPQKNHLCTHTNNAFCILDTHLHLDRGWTHMRPALHTDIDSRIWLLSCIICMLKSINFKNRLPKHSTYFTILAFETLWTVAHVGARLVLTCPPMLAGFRQAFIYVLREVKHIGTTYNVCADTLKSRI